MKIKDLSGHKQEEISRLTARIPFFKELAAQDEQQYQVLLGYSCLVELEAGETIMRRGDRGSWLYFLIKGRLAVFLDSPDTGEPLNYITPGELFGDLALLCNHQRKATVAADRMAKKVLLFATDFKPFGDILDFSGVNITTKLIFYRTMVHSIRWRLEVNRMDKPKHPLVVELMRIHPFSGVKGGVDELVSLHEQATQMADILDRWNSEGAKLQDIIVAGQ